MFPPIRSSSGMSLTLCRQAPELDPDDPDLDAGKRSSCQSPVDPTRAIRTTAPNTEAGSLWPWWII